MTRRLALEVSALAEFTHTGIGQVVRRLCSQGLQRGDVEFVLGASLVPESVIGECVQEQSGLPLQVAAASTSRWYSIRRLIDGHQSTMTLLPNMPVPAYTTMRTQLVHDLVPRVQPHTTSSDAHRQAFLQQFAQTLPSADLVVCVSESTRKDVIQYYGLNGQRVVAVSNSSEPAHLSTFMGVHARPYLLVLGTVEPRKNLPALLRVLSVEPWILDEWDVVFIGRDGWGTTFDSLITDYGLDRAVSQGRIARLPFAAQDAKWALLQGADALVFPSVFEGYGLPVAEAIAVGTRVVASRSSSIVEAAQGAGEDSVLWVDPEDESTISVALERLRKVKTTQARGTALRTDTDIFAEAVYAQLDHQIVKASGGGRE